MPSVEVILVLLALPIVAAAIFSIYDSRRRKRLGLGKRRASMGGGFGVMDELFHPNAHEARIIIEQKQEERVPMPSPEDKEHEHEPKRP
ncbi:MAG: hypothetical protein RL645_364 [Actinomycetota bacterium]|jgi:hypothetical protein